MAEIDPPDYPVINAGAEEAEDRNNPMIDEVRDEFILLKNSLSNILNIYKCEVHE